MNNLMIFEGHEVEVLEVEGQVLFNPYHVGECLGLSDSAVRMAISKMTEQMLYLLEEFIRFKLNKVSESINSHFKTVNFKLFEMQLNGGMKDCCECTVNGVPYSTLNSGHRIVAGLDIIHSLSELYGVSVPIFVDNAESLNEFNVPDMDAQLILLSVSEDKQLKVEAM